MENLQAKSLVLARHRHAAWLLLASRRGPLVIACLRALFSAGPVEVRLDDARERLASLLTEHINSAEFELADEEPRAVARRELNEWIKRDLLAERDGILVATDALQTVFRFIDDLESRQMTSTASRLSTVQQKIESLEAELNPDHQARARRIEGKIADLQAELARVRAGDFAVLSGPRAEEELRELYSLAMSLRADFRRVEDSYREADQQLRKTILSEDRHRGEVLDYLLNKNDELLATPEGRVFDGFHRQISQSTEVDLMRHRLRAILASAAAPLALTRDQLLDLRTLVQRLIEESAQVMRARARGERDVRSFIKSGLAGEHHRVGRILNELFEAAVAIDWSSQAVRRSPAPLPPLAPSSPGLPVPGRLTFKEIEDASQTALNLEQQRVGLDALAQSLRETGEELDREQLHQETLAFLRDRGRAHTLAELADGLPPHHDLETLLYWLTVARESGAPETAARETITPPAPPPEEGVSAARFDVPRVLLDAGHLAAVSPENLE